jgi:hypothetical protein
MPRAQAHTIPGRTCGSNESSGVLMFLFLLSRVVAYSLARQLMERDH